jgi:hypothetical protein
MDPREQLRLVVDLPLPAKALSPNARVHWRTKANAKAKARGDAKLAALSAIREQKSAGLPWESVTVQATFYKRTRHKIDLDNAIASLKASFDGLQDAGVIANDSGLIPLPPVFEVDKDDPRVVLVVEPTNATRDSWASPRPAGHDLGVRWETAGSDEFLAKEAEGGGA